MYNFLSHSVLIIITGCILYAVYYLKFIVKKPKLFCNERMQFFLKTHVPILFENFWPTFYLLDPRAQTIFKDSFIEKKNVVYARELLTYPDGEVVALDWSQKYHVPHDHKSSDEVFSKEDKERPIVIILTGLLGNSKEVLAKRAVEQCDRNSLRCVVLNLRAAAGMKLKTAKINGASDWEDLDYAIGWIHHHHPASPLMILAFSFGGMITTNYITSDTAKNLKFISGAMTVSMAWDCVAANKSMSHYINYYILQKPILAMLLKVFKKFKENFRHLVDVEAVSKSKTIEEFDNNFTARIYGFNNVRDYYIASSSFHKVTNIKIPYLNLTSKDDPFAPFENLPTEAVSKSDHVAIACTARGGHLGFVDALWKGQKVGYYEKVFVQFAWAVFKSGNELVVG